MTDDDSNTAENQPASADYEVGRSKPPKHTQFKPGQSGNPKGRPKDVNNVRTDLLAVLKMPLLIKEHGRPKKISTQRASILKLREKALQGDARALDLLLELALRFNNEPSPPSAQEPLAADDQAIVDRLLARANGGGDAVIMEMPPEPVSDGADGTASAEPPAVSATLLSAPSESQVPEDTVKNSPPEDFPSSITLAESK